MPRLVALVLTELDVREGPMRQVAKVVADLKAVGMASVRIIDAVKHEIAVKARIGRRIGVKGVAREVADRVVRRQKLVGKAVENCAVSNPADVVRVDADALSASGWSGSPEMVKPFL